MTDLFDAHGEANTPLSAEERAGLLPTYITTRTELNDAEQANISDADRWAFQRERDVLDVIFLRRLHKRMFGKVWAWAGTFSQEVDRRIGLDRHLIEPALYALVDDVRYWIQHQSYPTDEIAARFHHALTRIHPFPNGNGRHARLASDLLLVALEGVPFTWGGTALTTTSAMRDDYVAALRAADAHDLRPLLAFVRA
ncbi:mobile mystery protein B [Brevundimonas sp.]|uniref:mobile mystery protein B n=1 Tax=Brevundimonas sp. TaxID=1871086 RepID=UPI002E15DA09|nr:mobile mystery protein B [Brevundimonas sp.]